MEGVDLVSTDRHSTALLNLGAKPDPDFWRGKSVFLTGHTGFKGGWLARWLSMLGAKVTGYALPPSANPSFFSAVGLRRCLIRDHQANINDYPTLEVALEAADPEVILHLAAQPLVRRSYGEPLETYQTNVMGTANLLQAARKCSALEAVVVITSDKCYENRAWSWGYRETDALGGYDPYSNSKACQELVVSAFRQSYFQENGVAIATARAGNVIGGGDWSEDRLLPDAVRAYASNDRLIIRSPRATRPWQHVLEPLAGYLLLSERICLQPGLADGWNFGPRDCDVRTVEDVLNLTSQLLPGGLNWSIDSSAQLHEADLLKLDSSKSVSLLGWRPRWGLEQALEMTCEWYSRCVNGCDMDDFSLKQIESY
jgi:CDP-glucose 4,6-dehydratase